MESKTIGFIGLGLIGGSIAKAILNIYPTTKIIANASRESTLQKAYDEHLINNNGFLSIEAFGQCDIIFLCSPVKINCDYLKKLKDIVKPHCIITDVGSVKGDITAVARELHITNQFIGGHPMTGSELTGIDNSSAKLLINAYYILTVDDDFDRYTYDEFSSYISSLGAIPIMLSAEEHDIATATISHVPHIVASALVKLAQDTEDEREICKTIAAGGFKDITRIASSSPTMWQHIFLSNKKAVLSILDEYLKILNNYKSAIQTEDADTIISLWENAKEYRNSITIPSQSTFSVYEIFCDIDDKPGTLVSVLNHLSNANINIKNIEIIHNREFEPGVLRIELYNNEDLLKSKTILTHNNYYVRTRTKNEH